MSLGASKTARPAPSHFDISSILRPTERVSASIPCRARTDGREYHRAEAGVITSSSSLPRQAAQLFKRVIVIVPSSTTSDTRVTHLIPITPSFRHSLNQTPPSPSVSFFHQSSRPHITLTLSNGSVKAELRISSALTAQVQALISELKRLVEASQPASVQYGKTHSWAKFYPVDPPTFDDLSDDEITTPAAASSSSSVVTPASSSLSVQTVQTPMTAVTLQSDAIHEDTEEMYPNPFAEGFSRSAFLRKRLFARQNQWSSTTPIRIRLGTYNVNDKLPPPGTTELRAMVGEGEEDLLVFGLQEVDLRSQALLYSQGNVRAEEWEAAILRGLKERAGEFERIALTQYVGVVTIVFVRKTLRSAITRIETSERGIGLLGFGGNKAGVCVRMKVYDSTLCFVNSHLAAFATALERRRADYQVLLKTLTFPRPVSEEVLPAFEEFLPENKDRLIGIEDAHVLFWVGDLNYRVDMEDDILRAWVDDLRWKQILEKDQLVADISSGKSFVGFQEGPIDFPPSFKYVHGSSTLDTKRSPAYTDRILYKLPGSSRIHSSPPEITCQSYTSHEIFWSDHRPVTASYMVDVRVADDAKKREEYVKAERELERLEEVYRPSLEIEGTHLEFGDVGLGKAITKSVILRNKGRVPALFNFRPPSTERPICKPPIWPFPSTGVVESGSQASLRITVCVEESWARNLTLGGEDLNDVLVLQVSGGKDTFITVQATFLPTILTLPLSFLTLLPDPIRYTPLSQRKELAAPWDGSHKDKRSQKPVKEIWRLLEYLMSAGQGIPNLWTQSIDYEEIAEMVERLDTGEQIPEGLEVVVARTVLYVLGQLPSALVGERGGECEKAQNRDEAFAALEGVEQVNTNVLIGLMSVVRLCAGIGPTPKASPEIKQAQTETLDVPEQEQEQALDTEGKAATTDALDELDLPVVQSGEIDDVTELAPQVESVQPAPVANQPEVQPKAKGLDEQTVDELVQAVFGGLEPHLEGRRRFVKLLLEG